MACARCPPFRWNKLNSRTMAQQPVRPPSAATRQHSHMGPKLRRRHECARGTGLFASEIGFPGGFIGPKPSLSRFGQGELGMLCAGQFTEVVRYFSPIDGDIECGIQITRCTSWRPYSEDDRMFAEILLLAGQCSMAASRRQRHRPLDRKHSGDLGRRDTASTVDELAPRRRRPQDESGEKAVATYSTGRAGSRQAAP